MAEIHTIRHLVEREGWSVRRIAREFHIARKTVDHYLDPATTAEGRPRYRRRKPPVAPKMDPYRESIDAWLVADRDAPRKQRHTAHRIWIRLRKELGARVAESTVRHYVANRRRALQPVVQAAFLDLVFDLAEMAQVDWGTVRVVLNGVERKAEVFCMRLAYSGACWVQVFPHQRTEAFLAAHVAALEFFGGVPQHILYDNLPTAVVRVRGRDRDLTDRFQHLVAHYVFEPRFATPASGWEKGLVENLVGYAERNYFTPPPQAPDWTTLNAQLTEAVLAERATVLPRRGGESIGTLWDAERPRLLALPARPLRTATLNVARVTNRAWITHGRAYYSVPVRWVGQRVRVETSWDHLEVWADGAGCIARHPLGAPGSLNLVLDHYLDLLRHKPGGVRNARVVRNLGSVFQAYQTAFLEARPQAYGALVEVLFLFRRFPAATVLAALPAAQAARCFDAETLAQRMTAGPSGMASGADAPDPVSGSTPDYDTLWKGVAHGRL